MPGAPGEKEQTAKRCKQHGGQLSKYSPKGEFDTNSIAWPTDESETAYIEETQTKLSKRDHEMLRGQGYKYKRERESEGEKVNIQQNSQVKSQTLTLTVALEAPDKRGTYTKHNKTKWRSS